MKRILSLALIAVLLLCLVGCSTLIGTATHEVDATVTDVAYKNAWTQMIWSGKVMIPITHPAQYNVSFTYEGQTLTVDNKELYDYYKDKIGSTVKCNLITKYYDDGTVRQTLEWKEN